MDRRLTPANGRVAATALRGRVEAAQFVDGAARQIIGSPFLHRDPGGARDRQLLWGDVFTVYETGPDWVFGQSQKDGYVGYLHTALGALQPLTHRVTVRTSWAYDAPDFKQPARAALHFGSAVQVLETEGAWSKIALAKSDSSEPQPAYLPNAHLRAMADDQSDPVALAQLFLGTPYVWAGNSGFGIDCSGLVQAALLACGKACPGDSDLQQEALGNTLAPGTKAEPGDLFFWKGHVAMAVDQSTLIHANAHHMMVAYEPIQEAMSRIEAQGDGPVTRHARLDWF